MGYPTRPAQFGIKLASALRPLRQLATRYANASSRVNTTNPEQTIACIHSTPEYIIHKRTGFFGKKKNTVVKTVEKKGFSSPLFDDAKRAEEHSKIEETEETLILYSSDGCPPEVTTL